MSSDDYIAIIQHRGRFTGYHCSASISYPTQRAIRQERKVFSVKSIEEAIFEAQKIPTEYGYVFVNLKHPWKKTPWKERVVVTKR